MEPISLSGIGSLLSAGSSIFGGIMGSQGQAAANAQQQAQYEQSQAGHAMEYWNNLDQAWKFQKNNQDFATNMANSAYQRATKDMIAAGLNPILAYQQGGANAPTSSGSVPSSGGQTSPGSFGNAMGPLASGIASAGGAVKDFAALNNLQAQTDATKKQGDKAKSETDLNASTQKLTDQNTANAAAQKAVIEANKALVQQQTVTSAAQAAAAAAAARNSDADSGVKYVDAVVRGHQANSARSRAEIDALEADQRRHTGGGFVGETMGSLGRTTQTIGNAADRDIVQPVKNFFGKLFDSTYQVFNPGGP